MTTAALGQTHFRGRSDTNSVDTAGTFIAAVDTNFTWRPDVNFRMRFTVQETAGGNPNAAGVKLQANRNGGAFFDVTTSSTIVKAVDAGSSAEDTAITVKQLTGTGTFVNGRYSEDGSPATTVDLAASNNTEWEFGVVIVAADVAPGDTITMKVVALSGTSITATTVPTITVAKYLNIDAGSYSVSGQDVSLQHKWAVAVDAGSYSISGQNVTLTYGKNLTIGSGSYAITGQDVSLDYVSNQRAVVSWAEVSFAVGAAVKSVTVDPGSYSISGQAVSLEHAWIVTVDAGSYSISGQDVALSHGWAVAVDPGSYSISGQDVALTHAWAVTVDAGSYSINGQAVTLTRDLPLVVGSGSYSISGQDVTLTHAWSVTVDAGSYAITGQDVTLTKTGALSIDVGAGSYSVSGQDVTLSHGWAVTVDPGSYAISGQDVALLKGQTINIDAGSYAVSGQDVLLQQARTVTVDGGQYLISGGDVDLVLTQAAGAARGGFEPGFWAEQHRKIKEREEGADEPIVPSPPITALSKIPEFIAPPETFDDDDEIMEILELLSIVDEAYY